MGMGARMTQAAMREARVPRIGGDRRDLHAPAADYGRALPAALDVLVLGMGSDGHTASLFPGSPAVLERRRRVMLVESPKPPRQRITITPPVIAAARQVVVLVTGRDKAPAVARALDGDAPSPSEVPAVLPPHRAWVLHPPSGEGRGGEESRSRWSPEYLKKKKIETTR